MLSDHAIRIALGNGNLVVDPMPEDRAFQPVSIDLRLDDVLFDGLRTRNMRLHPGDFALASTIERVELNGPIVGIVKGKSSIARKGLIVEAAGLIDPGFKGQVTLELFNMSKFTVTLWEGMFIAQIAFDFATPHPARMYGDPGLKSRYQNQAGPTASRGVL